MDINIILYMLTLTAAWSVTFGQYTNRYECNLFDLDDDYKHINVSNPLERKVVIGIPDRRECWVDMSDMYYKHIMTKKVKLLLEENPETVILVKLSCVYTITLHFHNIDVKFNFTKGLDLDLKFYKCSYNLTEVDVFVNIGRIIILTNIGNSVITDETTACNFASELQAIEHQPICDGNIESENLFWESCTNIFPKMAVLTAIGCEYKYQMINVSRLQEKFPTLQSLVFNFVQINQPIHFPWYHSTQIQDRNMDDILKLIFDSYETIFFYSMFPATSMMLINCKVDTKSINIEGNIDFLSLTEMGLTFINSSLLKNVTIKQTLDLSKNRLTFISEHLLEKQHMLKELYLHLNKLTMISKYMFSGLKNLIYINLSGNEIKEIIGMPFAALTHLKDIIISNNSISDIPEDMFRDQTDSLEFLKIDSNPELAEIPTWPIYATNLKTMSIYDCNITGDSIVHLLDDLDELDINEKLVEGAINIINLPLGSEAMIDLRFNKIETVLPSENVTVTRMRKLKHFLSNFMIDFSGNPFTCNCDTSAIQDIAADTQVLNETEFGLICEKPSEFRGRPIWTIDNHDKYCPTNNLLCPESCSCFKRNYKEIIIVDCRDTILEDMPKTLPNSLLELWFQNSNISDIDSFPYLENVTVLNVAQNKLKDIVPSALNKFKRLKILNLESNHLTSLPIQISALSLSKLTLSDNLFVCDCTTKWMKGWILEDEGTIPDWTNIKCLDIHGNLQQLIAVPDSEFICESGNSFGVIEHVFLPTVITGSVLFVLVSLSLLIYFQRFNLKVRLFIHFNCHPFDNKIDREKYQVYDAVIIYTESDLKLKVKIDNHLKQKGYNIADMYKNSLIGYTYLENIEQLICKSNKVIIIISTDNVHDKIIQAAWNISYDQALSTSMTRLILLADITIKHEANLDINLLKFIKSNHFLDRNATLLPQKVEYLIPKMKSRLQVPSHIEMEQRHNDHRLMVDNSDDSVTKTVISYPDIHHSYIKNDIIPFLSENSIPVKLLDMEFTPGADIREELPTILHACRHLIFILSTETLYDEVRMYILSQALTQTQLENHNFLLVCTSGPICLEHLTNDLSRYIENYVTISMNDPKFKEWILESIQHFRDNNEGDEGNQVENDPLL